MPCFTSKSWEFTIFADDLDKDVTWLKSLEFNHMVVSKEVCPETNREHLQGSVTWKRSYSLAALKKMHPNAHWEPTIAWQDKNYAKKRTSEVLIDQDNRKPKGARTDIAEVKEVVKSTCSMRSVVDVATSVQSVRMAELWLKYHEPKRPITPKPEIHWRWGPAGVGKTRFIWDTYHIDEVYTPTSEKWWEGYDGHKTILIDEFDAGWCTFKRLLKLTDRYPFTVETKGGSRQMLGTTIFITSSYPPEKVYSDHHFDANNRLEQLMRRLTSVTYIEN